MTEFSIKSYEEGFEEEQARLGIEIARNWEEPHQTPADRLKRIYSQEDFDPETRLYCFKDEKMIGFLTSKITKENDKYEIEANLTPPIVLPKYEDAADLLIAKAIEVLKNKGVQKVVSRFGILWGGNAALAEKWGFSLVEDYSYHYKIPIENIDKNMDTDIAREFDRNKDLEKCAQIIANNREQSVEWAKGFFDWIEGEIGRKAVIANLVIEEGDEIVAFGTAVFNRIDYSKASLFNSYATTEKYLRSLLAKTATICEERGIKILLKMVVGKETKEKDIYEKIGFTYLGSNSFYETKL